MPQNKVLLVEDYEELSVLVHSWIGKICDLTAVTNLKDAERALASGPFNLMLLDVGLPDGDGFEFCEKLRKDARFENLPIIFLTGQGEVESRVRGFTVGADDYVVKPVESREFIARVKAKLHRSKSNRPVTLMQKGPFQVDLKVQQVFVQEGAQPQQLELTPIEFKLFVHFLNFEGEVVSRDQLILAAWGKSVHVTSHTVDTHISSLRKQLKRYGCEIKAVVRKGYCFYSNPAGSTQWSQVNKT